MSTSYKLFYAGRQFTAEMQEQKPKFIRQDIYKVSNFRWAGKAQGIKNSAQKLDPCTEADK